MKRLSVRHIIYIPILATAMGLMFMRLLLMAHFLSVEQFAQLNLVLISSSAVTMLVCCGLLLELQRKLPALLFQGGFRSAAVLSAQTYVGAIMSGAPGFMVAAIGITISGYTPLIIVAGSLHGISQLIYSAATTESRSNGDTVRFAWQNLLRALMVNVVSLLGAVVFDSALAIIAAETVATTIISLSISRVLFKKSALSLLSAIRIGARRAHRLNYLSLLALLLLGLSSFISLSIDRWLASIYLPAYSFSIFSFAWMALLLSAQIQSLINASIFPFLARRYSERGAKRTFFLSSLLAAFFLAGSLLAVLPTFYLLEFLIPLYFPQYVGAIPLLPYLLIAACFRLADFWSTFLIVSGSETSALMVNTLATVLTVMVWAAYLHGHTLTPTDIAKISVSVATVSHISLFVASVYASRKAISR